MMVYVGIVVSVLGVIVVNTFLRHEFEGESNARYWRIFIRTNLYAMRNQNLNKFFVYSRKQMPYDWPQLLQQRV